ncbi:uncharacterized protein LOC107793019 [Nicotiana tabacum]|uniref:Uncharacterized protein LOC107793019 n=1 Tax=Nicotiana tabacum TaxID=4097 RepID=A0AC58UNU4_TOBAC
MGKGVAKSSPTLVGLTSEIGATVVWSEESVGEEESVREKGGSGSGEAAKGLVRLGKNVQEPVPSEREPLEDLLRKVSDNYPKKKKSSRVKVHGTARANKKRKAASSIPVETPRTRERATRSQKKQSEAKLEKALEESKRKTGAKGKKKKVIELAEEVEFEEMDLVLRDEEEDKEMEVETPKAKKIKTSKKKFAS